MHTSWLGGQGFKLSIIKKKSWVDLGQHESSYSFPRPCIENITY
jgi:hypothetical protein